MGLGACHMLHSAPAALLPGPPHARRAHATCRARLHGCCSPAWHTARAACRAAANAAGSVRCFPPLPGGRCWPRWRQRLRRSVRCVRGCSRTRRAAARSRSSGYRTRRLAMQALPLFPPGMQRAVPSAAQRPVPRNEQALPPCQHAPRGATCCKTAAPAPPPPGRRTWHAAHATCRAMYHASVRPVRPQSSAPLRTAGPSSTSSSAWLRPAPPLVEPGTAFRCARGSPLGGKALLPLCRLPASGASASYGF